MNYSLNWLADPYVYEVNRMDAHSDHKFFHTYTEYENEKSSFIQNLNGIWKFKFAENPSEWAEDFYRPDFECSDFGEINVPGHIELQGYGCPQYVNTMYPWEGKEFLRPPHISEKNNPVGSYIRYFDIDEGLKNKRIIICLLYTSDAADEL